MHSFFDDLPITATYEGVKNEIDQLIAMQRDVFCLPQEHLLSEQVDSIIEEAINSFEDPDDAQFLEKRLEEYKNSAIDNLYSFN